MNKRTPYGISDFKTLVEENYYYVDKTEYIEIIENFNEKYIFFLRPRKFGKSLFISMLDYYYDRRFANDNIFDGFYIGKNPTPLKNSYCVLRFSFSHINTILEENTVISFNVNVAAGIQNFLNRNNIDIILDTNKSAGDQLIEFLSKIPRYIDKKIYVLIDEYDHFANELLGFQEKFFQISVSKNGFIRTFYEAIKDGTSMGIVDRVYITGVSSITLDSMTSGFNIAKNMTLNPKLNEMMGFTRTEVIELTKKTLSKEYEINRTIEHLEAYYNGYKFHIRGKERLFNSDMVLYFISELQQNGIGPENYTDHNILSDYSKICKLFEIGGMDNERIEVLRKIIRDEEIEVRLRDRFNLEIDFELEDFKSLLFFMGFITIRHSDVLGRIFMQVPNYVIKELYFGYFQKLIEKETEFKINETQIDQAIAEIALYGKIDQLVRLAEETLNRLSNRDFIKFDEKYIKVILLTYLFKTNVFFTKSEYEVDDGYIDIVLLKGSVGQPEYFACLEIKYISQKKYSKELLDKKLLEAKNQLAKYNNSKELKNMKNLKKFAIVFCFDKCKIIEDLNI